jgi:hypothetical protein
MNRKCFTPDGCGDYQGTVGIKGAARRASFCQVRVRVTVQCALSIRINIIMITIMTVIMTTVMTRKLITTKMMIKLSNLVFPLNRMRK